MVKSPSHSRQNRPLAIAVVVVLVPGVGAADFLSGSEATFSVFYLVPVVLATWYSGRIAGWATAVLCVISTLAADFFLLGGLTQHVAVVAWNALSRLLIYGFTVWLLARLQVALQTQASVIAQLQAAMQEIRTLRGLLPICAWCKRIRDENDNSKWKPIETYVAEHSDAEFTHGICPDCAAKMLDKRGTSAA